eukprot:GILJ01032994.1.p1 GENE.GILJ01032994.1~~GILJ01032994.1.p1  ORF type:complete len:143 (+),score=0.25 GILJ01032994.1:116-544(+)
MCTFSLLSLHIWLCPLIDLIDVCAGVGGTMGPPRVLGTRIIPPPRSWKTASPRATAAETARLGSTPGSPHCMTCTVTVAVDVTDRYNSIRDRWIGDIVARRSVAPKCTSRLHGVRFSGVQMVVRSSSGESPPLSLSSSSRPN